MIKFYESHFDEYCLISRQCNLHPELQDPVQHFPKKFADLNNIIIHGPSGSGKYSQTLRLIQKYSPTELKYEKKITVQTDKHNYIYHISDVHYEVDMSLLGCNSKILWAEVFSQIIDIVSVKTEKIGIILCKNFHTIHTELLEIFYSYIQQYSHPHSNIHIKFILLSDHVSFIPNNILNSCYILSITRPSKANYSKILKFKPISSPLASPISSPLANTVACTVACTVASPTDNPDLASNDSHKVDQIMEHIKPENMMNIKEMRSLLQLDDLTVLPKDLFNTVCDNIIKELINHDKIIIPAFRDTIYDILIYNLDIGDVLWYILSYFVKSPDIHISAETILEITNQIFTFLKYYNNNYRPIYHLESIFFYFITKIYKYES
jgi:hypothetical protein